MQNINSTDSLSLEQARLKWLAGGLNHMAFVSLVELPRGSCDELAQSDPRGVLLLAASGTEVWRSMRESGHAKGDNPVDDYSRDLVCRVLSEHFGGRSFDIAYPGAGVAPLMALGEYLNWTWPSPLGLGIHGERGLWFAWRVLVRIDLDVPSTTPVVSESPCLSCKTQDCVSACPAGAVSIDESFELNRCFDFRVKENSPCAASCLSRLACPVAREHQYDPRQFEYHQIRSLAGIRRWLTPG